MKNPRYDTLAALPLFLGMDGSSLAAFCKEEHPAAELVRSGTVIAAKDSLCRTLAIIISGDITVATPDSHGLCILEERMPGYGVVEPQRLFGLHNAYLRTYTAASQCQVLRLPKQTVVSRLLADEVFRLNFMNLVSSVAQRAESLLSPAAARTPEERLAAYVLARSLRPAGEKTLRVKMTDLAAALHVSRLTLSRTLHSLRERGLAEFTRTVIVIPSLEKIAAAR